MHIVSIYIYIMHTRAKEKKTTCSRGTTHYPALGSIPKYMTLSNGKLAHF